MIVEGVDIAAEVEAIRAAFGRAAAEIQATPDIKRAFLDASALSEMAKQLESETAAIRAQIAARLADTNALSITQIAKLLGLSRSRAAQLVAAGRAKGNPAAKLGPHSLRAKECGMRVCMASEPGSPDVPNEDWAGSVPSVIVVLDGVSIPEGMDGGGCVHGTPWYVRQLGVRLLTRAAGADTPLKTVLGDAIKDVAGLHGSMCDLSSLSAPSAAVGMLRFGPAGTTEYLVLADTTIVLQGTGGGIVAVTDDRVSASTAAVPRQGDRVGALIAERRAADRNRAGGYWVAAADPQAATHAITGEMPTAGLQLVAVMTDGASRLADMFGLPWEQVLSMDARMVIRVVRHKEASDPAAAIWPRFKVSDDATVALCEVNNP